MRPSITLPAELARQSELIDAAIAVNEAPTLDEAFQVLASTGLGLLDADRLVVVVWNENASEGTLRADAGSAVSAVGETIPGDEPTARALLAGEIDVSAPRLGGLGPEVASSFDDMSTVVRVPVVTDTYTATFHAFWREALEESAATEAGALLGTLARLTTLAERSLRERGQKQLDFVLDGVADGVVLSSPSRVVLNEAARRILAAPPGIDFRSALANPRDMNGTPYTIGANDMPGQTAIDRGHGDRFRIRATAFDGRELVLDGSVAPAGSGAVIVFRDVTDEHRENQLNRDTLAALFDAIPTAISVSDPETYELLAVNTAFCNLVGRRSEDIVGLQPPYPWWEEGDDGTFMPTERSERVYRRPDGRPQPVELSVHLVRNDDGSPALLLALIQDIGEQRRMQQQLVQSGKLAAIGELAAGVAHEINNPLFAILGLTEFLLKEAEPGSRAHQRLDLIQQTGLEIKEIVRALLDFARENADERHVVALDEVVRSTVDLLRRTNAHKGVELVESYSGDSTLVNASPNQLKQIFLNLFANARQAMPNGGTVSVDVRREGETVLAVVSDDGPGIEPEVMERIFQPFFTTKRLTGGTGLGLSVSLGIAEGHGGRLTVDSQPGRGATFTLCLPAVAEDEAEA